MELASLKNKEIKNGIDNFEDVENKEVKMKKERPLK